MVSEPTPHGSVSEELLKLLEGFIFPEQIGLGRFEVKEFAVRDGWKCHIYYDCGELDYIDYFISPDGICVDFWDWPESIDKDNLIAWRGNT